MLADHEAPAFIRDRTGRQVPELGQHFAGIASIMADAEQTGKMPRPPHYR
jgi:hypothetical protein